MVKNHFSFTTCCSSLKRKIHKYRHTQLSCKHERCIWAFFFLVAAAGPRTFYLDTAHGNVDICRISSNAGLFPVQSLVLLLLPAIHLREYTLNQILWTVEMLIPIYPSSLALTIHVCSPKLSSLCPWIIRAPSGPVDTAGLQSAFHPSRWHLTEPGGTFQVSLSRSHVWKELSSVSTTNTTGAVCSAFSTLSITSVDTLAIRKTQAALLSASIMTPPPRSWGWIKVTQEEECHRVYFNSAPVFHVSVTPAPCTG